MVTIIRRYNGERNVYKLRDENRKLYKAWFRTMKQAREYAESLGLTIIERPDLIKKWSSPQLNKAFA